MDYSTACQWLSLDPSVELDESILKSAFRRTAVREHPDKSQHEDATQRFQSVKRAHDFLIQCVAKQETGSYAPSYTDENDGGDDDDDDDGQYYDGPSFDDLMAHIFARQGYGVRFSHGRGGPTVHIPVYRGGFGGPPPNFYSSYSGGGRYNYDDDDDDDDDDEYYHQYYQRKKQEAQRKAEAAKRRAEAEELHKAQARVRAQEEGRDCFEEWPVKSLNQEATRRGFNIRGLQSQSIVDLLIEDERRKRETRELKEELAPLLEEWVEIVNVGDPSRKNLNGLKARAVSYDREKGRYVVEWDDPSTKKKSQQHRDMYGDKAKASLKPENLILWGSRPPTTSTTSEHQNNDSAAHKEEKQKKSRRESMEAAKKRQEEKQQAKKGKRGQEEEKESPMDRLERLEKEMAGQVDLSEGMATNENTPSFVDSTKYIQHKVKCPLDKKAGDFLEFTNPHIPGQKQRVQIPLDAKPEKFFKVNVPLPAKNAEPIILCARCVKHIQPKKDDGDLDTLETPVPLALPLRSCAHYCCEGCFSNVQEGGKCPTCSSPLPQPESLDLLPYIQQLDNPPIALKEAFIEEYFAGKESDRSSAGKKEQDTLEEASNKATRAVEKHYRRASIKVHPDRYGEEFRKEFDGLTKARDILRDPRLRRKYLSEMIDIACRVDPGYIPQSHLVWVEKNSSDAPEASRPPPKPGKAEVPLYLDGGIAFTQAKRPRSFVQSAKARQVRLYLPISGLSQFLQYCESVTVIGDCGDLEDDEITLAHITKSQLDIQDREIRFDLTLPVNGIWDISWCSILVIDGTKRQTPYSSQTRIDIRSDAQLSMAERKDGMETLARHLTNEIRSRLRSHRLVGADERQKIEASHSSLHQGISKGRDVAEKLLKIIRSMGAASSPAYKALLAILDEASDAQTQLEETVQLYGKRDSRKAFKNFIASKPEHGGSEAWMSSVTDEELVQLGGDANRLYQLLIEGKKANALAFNDSTLEAASKREDLFSTKQREALHTRKLEVEYLLTEEMEEAVKKEIEQKERKRMEEMASRLNVKRGDYVKIQGLEGRSDLNGAVGTFLGIAHGERYTVCIHVAEKDFALKASNFKEWDLTRDGMPIVHKPKAQAKPWSCRECTFVHQDALAHETECEMCGAAKDGTPLDTSGDGREERSGSPNTEKATEDEKLTKKISQKSKWPAKAGRHAAAEAPPAVVQKPKKVEKTSPALVHHSKAPNQQPNGNCGLGLFCPELRRGPEACQFEHLPEEIAVYHPEHPSAIAATVLDTPLQSLNKTPAQGQVPESIINPKSKKSVEAAAGRSVGIAPGDKRAAIRCKYRGACVNLMRGLDKCKFHHTPDEIAAYHPTPVSGSETLDSNAPPPKSQAKPVARCKNGINCRNLRKGPSICHFFHPMEEIVVYHPNHMASNVPSASAKTTSGSAASLGSASENKKKDVHRNLLVGADIAPTIVGKGGKRILALRKKSGAKLDINRKVDANGMCTLKISGTQESVEEAIRLVNEIILDKSSASSEGKQQIVHRNILVEANSVPILLGNNERLIKSIMNKTGAKVIVSREADSNGCCNVAITGSGEAVQKAAQLVVDASLGANGSNGHAATEEVSLLSELTGDDLVQSKPTVVTPTPVEGEHDLLAFLHKHKSSFKCTAQQFYKSLKVDDISTLSDLAEACKDEDYTSVLQANGLKGFKRGPFVKAVQHATVVACRDS